MCLPRSSISLVLDVLNVVKNFGCIADLIGIARQHTHQSFIARLKCNDMFAVGKNDAADGDLIKRVDGFADDGESIVAGFAVRNDVVGTDEIQIIDLASRHELVNLDSAGGFERDSL